MKERKKSKRCMPLEAGKENTEQIKQMNVNDAKHRMELKLCYYFIKTKERLILLCVCVHHKSILFSYFFFFM